MTNITTRRRSRNQSSESDVPAPELVIVNRRIGELNFAHYNPRKMTPQEREDLRSSIRKFKIVDPAIINVNPERKDIVIGGHQRIDVAKEEGYEFFPCIELNLSEGEEKELNLRLNKNLGHWDAALLQQHFHRDDLKMVGFLDSELEKLFKDDADKMAGLKEEPTYPITARVDEGYDGVLVFCKSKIDMLWLKEVLGIAKEASYKCDAIGETRVIKVEEFRERLRQYAKENPQ